jgi:hypothetical protein
MAKVTLPNLKRTKANANLFSDVVENDEAIQKVINGEIDTENLKAAAGITGAQLASPAKPVTWYMPKVVNTEETRENTTFGTLTTKDEITGVVLPENGLIVVGYQALAKASVASAGRVGLFLGANQLKVATSGGTAELQEATVSTGFRGTSTYQFGLIASGGEGPVAVTTGQVLASSNASAGGVCHIFAAAGTYNVSVQYRATSGNITAKERKLWVYTLGF